jgi:hypothetical protein
MEVIGKVDKEEEEELLLGFYYGGLEEDASFRKLFGSIF